MDEACSSLGADILAAARADMEFRTNLTAARHHLANLLNAFSDAVCRMDAEALDELMRTVCVILDGHPESEEPASTRIIDWFGHPRGTVQTVSNLSIRFSDGTVLYSATYQDWDAKGEPRCTDIGRYAGRLKAGPQVWRWEEHRITRLTSLAVSHQHASHETFVRNRGQSHLKSGQFSEVASTSG